MAAPLLSAATAAPPERAEAHPRDVDERRGPESLLPAPRGAQHLCRRQGHGRVGVVGLAVRGRRRKRRMLDDRVVVDPFQIVVGAEPEVPLVSFEEAYTQRRWSRLKGRSSSLSVTMYWRSSGPTASSRKRKWPTIGKLRRMVCRRCRRSQPVNPARVPPITAATDRRFIRNRNPSQGRRLKRPAGREPRRCPLALPRVPPGHGGCSGPSSGPPLG